MFERLQQKWKVNGWRLLLILVTFALGGSLCGYLGRQLLGLFQIESAVIRVPLYIILVTILWPFCVILISIPLGQFTFFRSYLQKMGNRMRGRKAGLGQPVPARVTTQAGAQMASPAPQQPISTQPTAQTNTVNQEAMPQSVSQVSEQPSVTRVAVFASGAGSNAQKIIDHFRNHPSIRIALIVCNKPGAGVLGIAEREHIPVLLIEKETFFRGNGYVDELKAAGIEFVVLAGFLWKVPASLTAAYPNRMVNIHPALLPRYGGKGMYGMHVHEAVIAAGEKESGITIHYVDNVYDNGAIVYQATCAIEPGDSPAVLARKVHELEHAHYPRIIQQVIEHLQNQR
ncbi:phosphoribosylglycinamide formyltransferase [Paraflavitalea sp. CAU 1676]|uniref:phosphoribosylglycinamide formyltransferase n=1 Tax=Paraflavitalea sp. CAU 1676 TaxID=3032598 RepID=UPI0023DC91A7|nr:phosphoribosylglycinamide formyltransferase [Paraflavitalea sp. CAU 1676]MDF2190912.1 phosphoribosylglycinamide formyltransferase [Paraflavitalea sp. CAU 1676]